MTKKPDESYIDEFGKKRRPDDRFTRVADFGPDLRGFGGKQTVHIRALKGSKIGPANAGRRLSQEERKKIEAQMRKDGKL